MLFCCVCVVVFCCFVFCFCCAVNIVIDWIIEHTGHLPCSLGLLFSRTWVLEEEGTIGVAKTSERIIGKSGGTRKNPQGVVGNGDAMGIDWG